MAENICKDTDHASDQHEALGQWDDDHGLTSVFTPELLTKDLIIKEVLETLNPLTIAKYVGDMMGTQHQTIRGALQPGMKRPYAPPVDDPDSVSLYTKSRDPHFRENGHNDSIVPKEDSFVAITQGTTDNVSDLFPQKSIPQAAASKADKEQ